MAFDNLFFDDQSYPNFNVDIGTDSSLDSFFGIKSDFSSIDAGNEPSDESLDSNDDENWNSWLGSDQESPEYLADASDECPVESEAANKIRKFRRTECEVQDPAKELPSDFSELSIDMQEQLYRRWACPSKRPGETLIPVCSSRLTQNTHFDEQISNPGVWSYTLMDSFICTSLHDHILHLTDI